MKLKHKNFLFFSFLGLALLLSGALTFFRSFISPSLFVPAIFVVGFLWLFVFVMFFHLQVSQDRLVLEGKEHDDILKQIRFLNQEIEFYEKRQRDLTSRSAQRKKMSMVAREMGSLLDPAQIQEALFRAAQSLFNGRFVQITIGQDPDAIDQFILERKQPLHLPNNLFKTPPLIAAPIFSQGAMAGILRVGGEPGGEVFERDDLRTLEILTSFASSALNNAFLFSQVQENALRDNLTGLWTHKVFLDQLENEVLQASRFNQKISVILADVDHFKSINDTYGHQAGDQVLQGFSSVFSRHVRDVDFVARYGGEEFVIMLIDTPLPEAISVAEALRKDLERQRFSAARQVISVTASFGVSTFPDDATSAQQLVRKADARLYLAKNAGRNKVVGKAA